MDLQRSRRRHLSPSPVFQARREAAARSERFLPDNFEPRTRLFNAVSVAASRGHYEVVEWFLMKTASEGEEPLYSFYVYQLLTTCGRS